MATSQWPELPPLPRGKLTDILYMAPLTFLPLVIFFWIMYGGTVAKWTFVASWFVPFAVGLVRSHKAHTRRTLYPYYQRTSSFVTELHKKVFFANSSYYVTPSALPPDDAALYARIHDFGFPTVDIQTLNKRSYAAWDAAFNELLSILAPLHPPNADFSSIPFDVGRYFSDSAARRLRAEKDQQEAHIQLSIERLTAGSSWLFALTTITNRFSQLPSLPPHIRTPLTNLTSDLNAVYADTHNLPVISLPDPPASTRPQDLPAYYKPLILQYFYGQWKELKGIKADLRYTLFDLTPALDQYVRAFTRAEHYAPQFQAVIGDPACWHEQFYRINEHLERDVQQYLATSGQFIIGLTATAQQPAITSLPPYAITLTPSERRTHTYVIGRTGSGKTTLLKNLITQDLRNDQQGVVVLSPENKIFEDLLDLVPPDRAHSLIYFDPTDTRPPVIGFNPFTFEDGDDLNQKAQETYTIFERALGDLGVKMTTMLQNAAYALIQRKNSRLLDLDTLLNPSNNSLRHRVARDPAIDERTRNFWQSYDSSAYYKSAYEPVVNRLDPFFRPPHATILSTNSFSWDEVLNKKPHIIFCNLSRLKGVEAQIMGQLLIAQIQQTIFHRDPKPESSYIPYALYVDEFQTYATTGEQSFIETLNKARKYHFALTLAHQVTSDIPPKLLSSIVGNVGTVMALRTSAEDAPFFAKDLQIKDADGHSRPDLLQNLPIGQAIVRTPSHNIGIAIGVPAAPPPLARETLGPSLPRLADTYAATLKTLSKRNFGTQPTLSPQPADTVAQQPISNATAAVASDDETAAAVIVTAPEPEPDSADPGTIVIDETENPLTRTTRRRGRPPRSRTADPTPAPSRRRRISPNGDGTNE